MTDPDTPPQPCPTCRRGCACNPDKGESCDHYGCHGRPAGQFASCPGAVLEAARYEAIRAADAAHSRILKARRAANSHAYARNLAQQADAARGEVQATVEGWCPPVES